MKLIRNILAIIGVLSIGVLLWIGPTMYKYKTAFDSFDPKAFDVYKDVGDRLVETATLPPQPCGAPKLRAV